MPNPHYRFFWVNLSNQQNPLVSKAHTDLPTKKAAYKELRKLAKATPNGCILIMALPENGGLRTVNAKGEVIMLQAHQPASKLTRLLQAA